MPVFNKVLVIDFETYYNTKEKYSLKNMTNEEYIRDAKFKVHGAALKWYGENENEWYTAAALPAMFAKIDWSKTAVLAHNCMFDGAILTWVYNVAPAFYMDTLSMSRAVNGPRGGNGLADLATRYGLPSKGDALVLTDGVRDLSPALEARLGQYCEHDNALCSAIFHILRRGFPTKELRLIDMLLRMYLTPTLLLDRDMLYQALKEDTDNLSALLTQLNITEKDLASDAKFAEILEGLDVEVPQKTTPKGNVKAAFAKSDVAFQTLLDSDNTNVAALCEARLRVKSTQSRTRAQRLVEIAERGALPVPLYYYGALTGRIQAARGQAINMQNMKRGSFLRRAIMAPKGYVCGVVDLSQIEPRVLAWYAGYQELLNIFASGVDAYSQFGSTMFGIPGLNKQDHPVLRQSAKSAMLGCGYGLSWRAFAAQLLTGFLGAPPTRYDMAFLRQMRLGQAHIATFMSNKNFVDEALKLPHSCTDLQLIVHCIAAHELIQKYRTAARPVTRFWSECDRFITHMLDKEKRTRAYKNLVIKKNQIRLPNGMHLTYPNLRHNVEEVTNTLNDAIDLRYRVVYDNGKSPVTLYGSKLTENIVQAVARIVMTDGMLRIQKRYSVVLTVHDEALALIPEKEAEEGTQWMIEQMTSTPDYLPGIPLAAEGGFAERYGDAKK